MQEGYRAALIQESIELLKQLHEVIANLGEHLYTTMQGPFKRGGIGKHVRHVLDHYTALLGATEGVVNYEARTRDPDIEQYPQAAVATIESIVRQLSHNRMPDLVSQARHVWDSGEGSVATSLERELQFLASYTVHHMSLVAWSMDALGAGVPERFGVAPSTLRYEAVQSGTSA